MNQLTRFLFAASLLLVTASLSLNVGCTGNINSPQPTTPAPPAITATDQACPTAIPDQPTNVCPRLKNMTLTCGGNGKLHTSLSGGSGSPFLLGAKLDDGSNFSAVFVVINCQDGPREGVTFGVTYTGQVAIPTSGSPCISQSKAVYSQFQFGDPLYAGFEGLAKDQMQQTFDKQSITSFASSLGFAAPATPRCSTWREMP